jgi:AcrR family transcriptional regulator
MKSKSEETQERILDQAAKIFVKDGYAASRTNEIAKASGVSEGTVFKYYKSKQGILDAVVDAFVKKMTKKLVIDPLDEIFETYKDGPPELMFKAIFLNRIALVHTYKNYALVTFSESRFHSHIKDIVRDKIMPEIMVLGNKIVGYYQDAGVFRRDIDPWLMMRSMMSSVVGMLVTNEILGIEPRGGSLEKELEMIVDMILSGIKIKGQ